MRYIPIYVAVLAALTTPCLAENPEEGTGLVCDKPEQIVSVMESYEQSRNWNAAMAGVNPTKVVCAVSHILYLKGAKVRELDTKDGHFNIVEILVVAAVYPTGVRPVPPEKQVTLFRPKGQDT